MRIILLTIIVFLAFCSNTSKDQPKKVESQAPSKVEGVHKQVVIKNIEDYIGLEYYAIEKLLSDHKSIGGTFLKVNEEIKYSINKVLRDSTIIILFEERVWNESYGRNIPKVIDAMELPRLNNDERVIIGACKVDDFFVEELICICKNEDDEYLRTILHAWKADMKKRKLIKIDPANIICENVGYGA